MTSVLLSMIMSASLFLPFGEAESGGEAYFCEQSGTELVYERREADSGELKWIHTMTIGSVSTDSDGVREVSYKSDFKRPDGSQMYGGSVALKAKLLPGGEVLLDASGSVASVFKNIFPDDMVESTPVYSALPSDLQAGDVLPDVQFSVKVAFAFFKVSVSKREALRQESIETPAGSFKCIVVREHKEEHGLGHNRSTTALTWYAKGLGMVRHDTYDKNLKLETSERLLSIDYKKR